MTENSKAIDRVDKSIKKSQAEIAILKRNRVELISKELVKCKFCKKKSKVGSITFVFVFSWVELSPADDDESYWHYSFPALGCPKCHHLTILKRDTPWLSETSSFRSTFNYYPDRRTPTYGFRCSEIIPGTKGPWILPL